MNEPTVKQADARILREALALLWNRIDHSEVRQYILTQLKAYADAVRPYCSHVEAAKVETGLRCLDCGADLLSCEGGPMHGGSCH